MIKNLLKIEEDKLNDKNKDIFKVILSLVLYLVIFGIFKAGLDYQKVIPAKELTKPEELKNYSYTVINQGNIKEIKFNEKKSIPQILDSVFENSIEIRNLREGSKIESIYGSKNIQISVNGKKLNQNLLSDIELEPNSQIEINY